MKAAIPERKAITEEISGLIERVTLHNDENGFCVIRVKVRGQRDEVTVLGSLPSVTAGEWLEAEGWWVRDKEHGLQFKTKLMKTVPPTTVEGIERLCSAKTSAVRNMHQCRCKFKEFYACREEDLFSQTALCEAELQCLDFKWLGSVTSIPFLSASGNCCGMDGSL